MLPNKHQYAWTFSCFRPSTFFAIVNAVILQWQRCSYFVWGKLSPTVLCIVHYVCHNESAGRVLHEGQRGWGEPFVIGTENIRLYNRYTSIKVPIQIHPYIDISKRLYYQMSKLKLKINTACWCKPPVNKLATYHWNQPPRVDKTNTDLETVRNVFI